MVDMLKQSDKRPALDARAPHDPSEKDPHEGKTKRTLTLRDRNLIVDGCLMYVIGKEGKDGKKERKDYKHDFKLERVKKLLVADDVWDYFGEMDDALFERINDWTGRRNRRRMWIAWKSGTMTKEHILEKYPDFDFKSEPERVPPRQPQLSDDEARGSASTFWIPNGLDHWILEALKEAEFDPRLSEYTTELREKYGLTDKE